MTLYQALGARLSNLFSPVNVDNVDPEALAPGVNLVDAWDKLLGGLSEQEREFAGMWPRGLQQAIQGAVHSAVNRPQRLPVTFGGQPSPYFQVTIWETSGGMSILLGMPVPH